MSHVKLRDWQLKEEGNEHTVDVPNPGATTTESARVTDALLAM
jgi:hypothetical protein